MKVLKNDHYCWSVGPEGSPWGGSVGAVEAPSCGADSCLGSSSFFTGGAAAFLAFIHVSILSHIPVNFFSAPATILLTSRSRSDHVFILMSCNEGRKPNYVNYRCSFPTLCEVIIAHTLFFFVDFLSVGVKNKSIRVWITCVRQR